MANVYFVIRPIHSSLELGLLFPTPVASFASAKKAFEFVSEWMFDEEMNVQVRQQKVEETETLSDSDLSDFTVYTEEGEKIDQLYVKNYFRGKPNSILHMVDKTDSVIVAICYQQTA